MRGLFSREFQFCRMKFLELGDIKRECTDVRLMGCTHENVRGSKLYTVCFCNCH
jgi:hypothetical protein